MNLKPIKKTRAYEQVIERILESIEQGSINPGDRLPSERELAEQLSASRSVIREAMSILQNNGIIDIRPGIGIFLMQDEKESVLNRMDKVINGNDGHNHLLELLEVRQGIEAQSAYLAAQYANEKDLKNIYTALVNLEGAVSHNLLAADEDLAFHLAVGHASKNDMIVELLQVISDRFLETLNKTRSELRKRNRVEEFIYEHRDIYNAIVDKDPEKARKLMTMSIENMKVFHKQINDSTIE
ncbi:FadR family transcriptional regulator [bacterium LRH843]|nr:FadR family transcriptional regulator [bacterium LRH843]